MELKKPLMCSLTFERKRVLRFERHWQKEKQNERKSELMCERRWQEEKKNERKRSSCHRTSMDCLNRVQHDLHCEVLSISPNQGKERHRTHTGTLYNKQAPEPKAKLEHRESAVHLRPHSEKVASEDWAV